MCIVSNVMDSYGPIFPRPVAEPFPVQPNVQFIPWQPKMHPDDLAKLIEAFKQSVAAAKVADAVTKQSDCEDPEKLKLLERVAELEKQLAAVREAAG